MQKTKLKRTDWLQGALDLMQATGGARLRTEELSAHLGVTTGSLYWHFKDRAALLRAVAVYWGESSTDRITDAVERMEGTAEERLLALMRLIWEKRAGQYDLAMRSWAVSDAHAAKIVLHVDRRRTKAVSGLFREMGFDEIETEARARVMLTSEAFGTLVRPRLSRAKRERLLVARHRMLCRPV